MSRTRKPSKATDEEITLFHKNTKSTISKTGLFFDPITGKYRKALKQDGKTKGSGRELMPDTKYKNYLKEVKKRMGEDQHDDIVSREEKAKQMGFSKLQKERKLFGQTGAGAVVAEGVAVKKMTDEAKKAVGKPPTNVRTESSSAEPKQKPPAPPIVKKITKGIDNTKPMVKKLKKRMILKKKKLTMASSSSSLPIEEATKPKKQGRPRGEPNPDGKDWYRHAQNNVRMRAEKKKVGSGEEAIKQWRAVQKKKYGLPSTAKRADIVKAHILSEEREKKGDEQDMKSSVEEAYKALQREQQGMVEGTNLRKKKRIQEEGEQKQQEDKIEEVNLDNDDYQDPLQEHGATEQTTHKSVEVEADGETKEDTPDYNEEFAGSRRRGQEFNNPEDAEDAEDNTQRQEPIPVPDEQPNVRMEITDREVEVEKSSGLGDGVSAKSFVSPQAERVSMERNRMKYSPKKLYEECKAFVQIYSDDIKTDSFRQLKKQFAKVSPKTKTEVLRKLHRELEEEVIEYYRGRSGIRLGVIIDPAVLGINISQLSSMMNSSMPLATGGSVREIGTQQQRTNVKDIHYHNGGLARATGKRMAEGDNLERHHKEIRPSRARVKIPIRPPNRYLLKRTGKSKLPTNLKIR